VGLNNDETIGVGVGDLSGVGKIMTVHAKAIKPHIEMTTKTFFPIEKPPI
jgi:hypothetical protein